MQEYIDFAGNNPLPILGFVAVLLFIIKLEISRFTRKYKQVNVNEAVMLLNKDNAVVVDVREDKELTSGIIKGARHITLAQLPQKIGELSKNKQSPVLVYCRSGSRSGNACNQLTKAGFEDVSNLAGGIMAWESANLPLSKR
ncbi:rhodanese-like domain-containing protein [uncultured Cocleimonas sp.]|uniref:rhodanese-like domain-containing protein n=1 Tax=uncultured Cocleimonas sp. TaxID=1051587 RepID=UPI002630CF4B|nr:rhodanese-like domain-containing protein [uncultured Cocleimonas sp.]